MEVGCQGFKNDKWIFFVEVHEGGVDNGQMYEVLMVKGGCESKKGVRHRW